MRHKDDVQMDFSSPYKSGTENKDRRILSPRKASIIPEAAEKAGRLLHAAFTGCQNFRAEKRRKIHDDSI